MKKNKCKVSNERLLKRVNKFLKRQNIKYELEIQLGRNCIMTKQSFMEVSEKEEGMILTIKIKELKK